MKKILLAIFFLTGCLWTFVPASAADTSVWCLGTSSGKCEPLSGPCLAPAGTEYIGEIYCKEHEVEPWCLKNSDKICEKVTTGACAGIQYQNEILCKQNESTQTLVNKPTNWCLTTLDQKCAQSVDGTCTGGESYPNEKDCREVEHGRGPTQGNVVKLINPIGGTEANPQGEMNLSILLGKIIKNVLGILGAVALLVFVYAGFMWVTAAGNADRVSAGASAMLWSAVGICIIFSSYAILKLIFESLLGPGGLTASTNSQVIGQACYCTTDGKPDTLMSNPTFGLGSEALCEKITTPIAFPTLGVKVGNCKWK